MTDIFVGTYVESVCLNDADRQRNLKILMRGIDQFTSLGQPNSNIKLNLLTINPVLVIMADLKSM